MAATPAPETPNPAAAREAKERAAMDAVMKAMMKDVDPRTLVKQAMDLNSGITSIRSDIRTVNSNVVALARHIDALSARVTALEKKLLA